LARVTGLCSDIAVKLAATSLRDEKALNKSQSVGRGNENAEDSSGDYTTARRPRVLRDGGRHAEPVPNAQAMADEDAIDGFEFATFVRELDALRLQMVGASFFKRVGAISRQTVMDDAVSQVPPSLLNAEHGLPPRSMQDAVARAVLLLNNHDDMAHWRR
jgi:hypothetical protein